MNPPLITILTPVWNGLPYIQEAVQSVVAQDFADWELIVGDNGSDDGTKEYLDGLSDPRIRVIKNECNRGIFGNLNVLFRAASAPLTCILCADDYLLPGGLERLAAEWDGVPSEVAFIRFNFGTNREGCPVRRLSTEIVRGEIQSERSDLLFFVFGNLPGNLSNVSVRTDRIREIGFFPEDLPYAGDFEMWSRMGRRWPFYVTDEQISFVRRHPGAASFHLNRKGELVAQQRRVVDGLRRHLEGRVPGWLLKLHGTINYDTLQRDVAVKALLFGRKADYLRRVDEAVPGSSVLFPLPLCWLIYLLSGGGRWGRRAVARRLLAAIGV